MCVTVYDVEKGRRMSTVREFAEYLGVDWRDLYYQPGVDGGPRKSDYCLCGVDIEHNCDRNGVWHRRDVDGDSAMHLVRT